MELKDRIRLARENAGLSIEDVAAALDYSSQAVKYWEQGINEPRPAARKAIEQLYKCNIFENSGDSEIPAYLADLTVEVAEAARSMMTMPKVIRHAILTIIQQMSCNIATTQTKHEAFSEIPQRIQRRHPKPLLATIKDKSKNESGENR